MPPAPTVPRPPPTHSAVIVAVPEAEPVVGRHRHLHDSSAPWGVPAHVTVLFPFMGPAGLDDDVRRRLTCAVAGVAAFTATFPDTGWFGEQVLWLAPEPADPFRRLTAAVTGAFPQHPPYEGAFDEVVPHLTVGELASGSSVEQLRAVERQVRPALPVSTRVTEVQLIVGRPEVGGGWDVAGRFPLA